jgi:hypothetical protein
MLQGDTKPIRRHIEGRFDEIKGITESSHPYLDLELSSWCVCRACAVRAWGRVCGANLAAAAMHDMRVPGRVPAPNTVRVCWLPCTQAADSHLGVPPGGHRVPALHPSEAEPAAAGSHGQAGGAVSWRSSTACWQPSRA